MEKLLKDVRQQLVETSSRNRLIHVNRDSKRSNSLNIVNERSKDIFEILRISRKKMRFKATGTDKSENLDDIVLAPEEEEFDESRFKDNLLETPLGPEALQRKLLRLFTDARTAEEEQGFNILYLAMGFLTWYEEKTSNVKREAPLILLPVELVRNERGSTFDIRCRDDDIATNLPLQERLKSDFGIKLPDIEDSEDWKPTEYFSSVGNAISSQTRWEIDVDGMQLGFFSFAKLLMLRDLDPENWPDDSLSKNEILNSLLQSGFESEPPLFGEDENLDSRLEPKDIIQIVDADASQTRVIEEVRAGRNLVVQGPPGTGKSQTITNIISAAVHDGKTVLFMAEKMAALNVVHSKLSREGLSGICLELHSRNANKKSVIQELERTLVRGLSVPNQSVPPNELSKSRNELNEIAENLHVNLPDHDYSPYSVLSEISNFIGRNIPPPKLKNLQFRKLTNQQRSNLVEHIIQFVEILDKAGPRHKHPFYGTGAIDLQPIDLQRLIEELNECEKSLAELIGVVKEVSEKIALSNSETFNDIELLIELLKLSGEFPSISKQVVSIFLKNKGDQAIGDALATGKIWRDEWDACAEFFQTVAWTVPVDEMRFRISKGVVSFWSRLFGGYRGACREFSTLLRISLPATPRERLDLLDKLITVRDLHKKTFERNESILHTVLGEEWHGESTDFRSLILVRDWVESVTSLFAEISVESLYELGILPNGKELSQNISVLVQTAKQKIQIIIDRLNLESTSLSAESDAQLENILKFIKNLLSSHGRYSEWVDLSRHANTLDAEENGLSSLRESLEFGKIESDRAVDEFLYAVAEDRWVNALNLRPEISRIKEKNRHQLVQKFCELDRKHFEDVRTLIRSSHLDRLPTGAVGEMGFLRGEIAKKRSHRPIRTLIRETTGILQRIKPVFLMSPISIAQFLPPNTLKFDILVIDEASQVRPADALGATVRANQIVVVGDKHQLPPTSFFDRVTDDDLGDSDEEEDENAQPETAKVSEMESILTLCEARGVRSNMLEWHYRSHDPSLIRVSNDEFYEDQLKLPPSPVQMHDDYGLKFTRVPGVYSSKSRGGGRAGTNRIEAEHIADALSEHARNWSEYSAGVVAFSKSQSDMITEVLEYKRREDSVLDDFLREGKSEEVFVKNIENVQGDERDVILISVGYGPHAPNEVLPSMNFGPVNSDGGERRLNVLFSRARIRCEVFASFDPGDINPERTKREGARVLKRFLDYAKSGQFDERKPTGEPADSPFEEDVARIIEKFGFHADHQVGSAGFRIDIGVRHPDRPGQYIMAVECDGATWHSSLWARERDRLRQDVLENLGWKFHRIWSTDWFYRRENEIDRLEKALENAKDSIESGIDIKGSNQKNENPVPIEPLDQAPAEVSYSVPTIKAPLYEKSHLLVFEKVEPHEISTNRMAELAKKVVADEGPVHFDVVTRRITSAFGKKKAGARIQQAVQRGLDIAKKRQEVDNEGSFWFTLEQKFNPPVRDRSREEIFLQKAEYFSAFEIRAAAKMITDESGQVEKEELIRAVSKLFGFKRAGPDLNEVIAGAMD